MSEERIVGLAWWQPEQWDRLKEISDDRDDLEDTHEEWRKNATRAIQDIQAQGQIVKKVKINLEELIIWCNERTVPVNGAARAQYSAYLLQRRKQ